MSSTIACFHSPLRKITLACMVMGIAILWLYMVSGWQRLPEAGIAYLIFAGLLNSILLLMLLVRLTLWEDKKETLKTIGILLLNIPVALVCMVIGIAIMQYSKPGLCILNS